MFNEEVFKFDIDNIKNDLAIEGMEITNADVDMYRSCLLYTSDAADE